MNNLTSYHNTMTTTEHLSRIRAKCVELLEIASKRTAGKWRANGRYIGTRFHMSYIGEMRDENGNWVNSDQSNGNSHFIAACAGPAEAGWKATIAAIDILAALAKHNESRLADDILAAWPEEAIL